MKKYILFGILAFSLMSFTQDTSILSNEEGMTVINTTSLCKDVKGYTANTPLKIYIKDGKILKIKPLRNKETVQYFSLIKKVLNSISWVLNGVSWVFKAYLMGKKAYENNIKQGLFYFKFFLSIF